MFWACDPKLRRKPCTKLKKEQMHTWLHSQQISYSPLARPPISKLQNISLPVSSSSFKSLTRTLHPLSPVPPLPIPLILPSFLARARKFGMESACTASVYEQGASVVNKVVLIGGHMFLVHGRVMSLPWLSLGRLASGGRHFSWDTMNLMGNALRNVMNIVG